MSENPDRPIETTAVQQSEDTAAVQQQPQETADDVGQKRPVYDPRKLRPRTQTADPRTPAELLERIRQVKRRDDLCSESDCLIADPLSSRVLVRSAERRLRDYLYGCAAKISLDDPTSPALPSETRNPLHDVYVSLVRWCETARRGNGETVKDPKFVAKAVAMKTFHVSESTLKRARDNNEVRARRQPQGGKTAAWEYCEQDLASRFTRRE